jgi:hypothetical protein
VADPVIMSTTITIDEIYALQARAVATRDRELLHTAYEGLGVSSRYAFIALTPDEHARAVVRCQEARDRMVAAGTWQGA